MPRHVNPTKLSRVAVDFAGQIATAVWLRRLTDEAAREVLWSYAMACNSGRPGRSARMRTALVSEYRRRREGQDACS